MESSSDDGLTIIYDEDASSLTFEWDNETHPEYNFLNLLTPEELNKVLMDYLHRLEAEDEEPTV
jgi:hypothetical protein